MRRTRNHGPGEIRYNVISFDKLLKTYSIQNSGPKQGKRTDELSDRHLQRTSMSGT
jgi:hypothetical protein